MRELQIIWPDGIFIRGSLLNCFPGKNSSDGQRFHRKKHSFKPQEIPGELALAMQSRTD